jgi:ribosomal protein S18 acetylase RimI-like enzyme
MQETATARKICRVTPATIDAAIDAWRALATAQIAEFADRDARATVANLLADPAGIVMYALENDTPVGLAVLQRTEDQRVRVDALGVLPAYRRRGIGGALLTQGLFAALPVNAMYLYVPEHDLAVKAWAIDRSFRPRNARSAPAPGGTIEYELRLDAPAEGCGSDGGCSCGTGGCGH